MGMDLYLFLTPIGLVIGIMLLARGEKKAGGWMTGLCTVYLSIIVVVFILPAVVSTTESVANGVNADYVSTELMESDWDGAKVSDVDCVKQTDAIYKCLGTWTATRESVEASMEGIDTSDFGSADWDAVIAQQSSDSQAWTVTVASDGSWIAE